MARLAELRTKPFVPPITIVDVGAAGSLISLGGLNPFCEIHGFEPRPDGSPPNNSSYASVHIHNFGLAGTSGTHTLYVTREPMASSLRPPNPDVAKRYYRPDIFDVVAETTIDCHTLDDLAKAEIIPERIDYLKIDTQGSEYDILRGGRDLLRQTSILTCETEFVPLYKDQPLFADVAGELASAGFRFIDFTDGEAIRGKRIWADALFAKHAADSDQALRMAEIMVALGQAAEARWMLREHNVREPLIDSICAKAPKHGLVGKLRAFNHQRRVDGKLHYDGRKARHLMRRLLPN
jgi:FkbM family methyltransferase